MQPILFQRNGVVGAGYLPGQYTWPFAVQFSGAALIGRPPTDAALTLALEVGGVLTGDQFTVPASALDPATGLTPEVRQSLALTVTVAPGQTVRWLATPGGSIAGAALELAVTMQPRAVSAAIGPANPALTVWYVDATGRVMVFNYAPVGHAFVPTSAAAGRATIVDAAGVVTVSLGGLPSLVVQGQAVECNTIWAIGSTGTTETPRLEFMIGSLRVATVSQSGTLRVAQVNEGTPGALSPPAPAFYQRFEFWSGGILTAALTAQGLTALLVQEPV